MNGTNVYNSLVVILPVMALLSACCAPATPEPTPTAPPPTVASPTATPAAAVVTLDDFEADVTSWAAGTPPDYADSSAAGVDLSTDYASNGRQSLAMSFTSTDLPKATFYVERDMDLADAALLQFEFFDPEGAAQAVAISLSTGGSWYWHESEPVEVGAEESTLTFDLQSDRYKTAATNWEYQTTIADLGQTKRLAIIVFPTADGTVYVDEVRIVESTTAELVPTATPPSLSDIDPKDYTLTLAPQVLEVARLDLLEMDVKTNVPARNPFDPAEINLVVHFTSPAGQQVAVPAFWHQDYDPTTLAPQGTPGWKARFTPTEEGAWTAQAEIADLDLQSESVSFQVAPSSSHGFVRVHPDNPRYLAFDDGTPFFMVGTNLCWWDKDPLGDYERWLDSFAANGGNTTRIWMASWAFAIEWDDTGLGDYTNRLKQAWLLDQAFRMAEERDIYILLVLINHGQFNERVNPEWDRNPYNAALGGPLDAPEEFVSNPQARELFKRRLRYIAARWSYSPNLLAWEWWNEINWTPISDEALAPWLVEMTAYLHEHDPNHHLTTQSGHRATSQIWQMPEIDIVQKHEYNTRDMQMTAPAGYRELARNIEGKPLAFTEFGYSTDESSAPFLKDGVHLHNGLWATTLSGYAGTGMYWWWDRYIEPEDLWYHFKGIAQFVADEDLTTYQPFSPLQLAGLDDTSSEAVGLGMRRDDAVLLWLRNRDYTARSGLRAYENALKEGTADSFSFEPSLVESHTLTLEGMTDGDHLVRWYDPQMAQWLEEVTVTTRDGVLAILIPPFTRDLAAKITIAR